MQLIGGTLQWVGIGLQSEVPLLVGRVQTPLFLEPTRVYAPNGISNDSAVFAQLTRVLSKYTDLRAAPVVISRIYALRAGDAA